MEARLRAGERYVGLKVSERLTLATRLRYSWVDHIFSEEYFHAPLTERCD